MHIQNYPQFQSMDINNAFSRNLEKNSTSTNFMKISTFEDSINSMRVEIGANAMSPMHSFTKLITTEPKNNFISTPKKDKTPNFTARRHHQRNNSQPNSFERSSNI